jgi:hypothetical protein
MTSPISPQTPRECLHYLIESYFHEDWSYVSAGDWRVLAAEFRRDNPERVVSGAAAGADDLAQDTKLSPLELLRGFNSYYHLESDAEARQWLAELAVALRG